MTNLTMEVALFMVWGKTGEEAKLSDKGEVKKLGEDILTNLKKLQIKEFPAIRADFTKQVKDKLWENDITVIVFGKRKTTIQFVGGVFAANKNIGEFHSTLSQRFKDFRFKRVNYKWYKYDDNYTYYTLDFTKDSEIKTID